MNEWKILQSLKRKNPIINSFYQKSLLVDIALDRFNDKESLSYYKKNKDN